MFRPRRIPRGLLAVPLVALLAGTILTSVPAANAATVQPAGASVVASVVTTSSSISTTAQAGVAQIQLTGDRLTLRPVSPGETVIPSLYSLWRSACSGSMALGATSASCIKAHFGGKRANFVEAVQSSYALHHCAQFNGYWIMWGPIAGTSHIWYIRSPQRHFGSISDCVTIWGLTTPLYAVNQFEYPGKPVTAMLVNYYHTSRGWVSVVVRTVQVGTP